MTSYKALALVVGGWLLLPGPAMFGAERSVAELTSALKSSDAAARLEAIDGLGSYGERAASAVAPLTELLKDKSPEVRGHAANSLGEIGAAAKTAVPALVELLKDSDAVVRRQAIKAVMAIRPGPQVTVPLCVKLLEESDPGIKMRVLAAITEAGPAAVPGLIEALKNDKAAYWACLVLRELGPAGKDAAPALIARLKDRRPEIRREVILALASMEGAAAPAISQIAAGLDDENVAVAATYALARIGRLPADAEVKIRGNVKSRDKMLSSVSAWALAKFHPEDKRLLAQAVEQLVERLKDDDPFVRVAAARGLAALPPAPEITMPIWEKALKDADETTLNHALDAIVRLGAPAVPKLIAGLENEKFRPHILQALRQMGPAAASASSALAGLIDDEDEETARSSILALAAIGPGAKSAVPALVKALKQKDRPDAHAIVYALGKIGPGAVDAKSLLLEIVAGKNQDLALISAWAVVKIDPSAAVAAKTVPVLVSGLTSPLVIVRRGAAEALSEMGPAAKSAAAPLERAAKDSDKSVRDAAAQALASVRR